MFIVVRVLRVIAPTAGWAVVFLALSGALAWLLTSRAPEGAFSPSERISEDYRQVLGRDVIAPVYEPEFLPAAKARLSPTELVMGVEIAGEARAYPVGFLNWREMVNDRIGPLPFLVTW